MEVFVSSEIINLTRAELYERVWTTPIQKLAREFSLSDVGLAKLCHRHEIPVPGRGYWARIQFGHTPGRVTLPALKVTRLDTIRILLRDPKKMQPRVLEAGEVFPTIHVPADDGPIRHRIARRIEKSMAKSRADDRGLLFTRQGRIVPMKLTSEGLPRALRILDALFAALDDAKQVVDWPSPYNTALKVVSYSEKLQFMMTESIERKEHKPTSEELARQKSNTWWQPHRWDYTPTGRLKFTLESCEYPGIRTRCATSGDRSVCSEAFTGYSRVSLRRCTESKSRTLEALHSHNADTGGIEFPNCRRLEPAGRTFGWCRGPESNIAVPV